MRLRLFLLLLLLGSSPVFAQIQPPRQADSLATVGVATSAPDTLAAIHQLFAAKRKNTNRFVFGTVGLIGVGGVLIGTSSSTFLSDDRAEAGIYILIASLPALLVEALKAYDYNKKNEQQAVADFQAHKLPRYLKRKLKPKYFR